MQVSRLQNMGWKANISLSDGLAATYEWFLANQENLRNPSE